MPAQGRAETIAEPATAALVSMVEPKGRRPLLRLFFLASITVSFLAASSAPPRCIAHEPDANGAE